MVTKKSTSKRYMNWFVLRVFTGKEYQIKDIIKKYGDENIEIMIFSTELMFKRNGIYKKVNRVLFPGYLFVKDNVNIAISTVKDKIRNEFIVPVCFKTEKCKSCFEEFSPCMVFPEEMELLLSNADNTGLFDLSYGYTKGDNIIITKGPLKNLNGRIIKVNKKKKVAQVELFLCKRIMKITLGIDIIKRNKWVESEKNLIFN